MNTAAPDDLSEVLRHAGLKVTAPRLEVLRALGHHSHVSADEIFERVLPALPGTSLQAVYGVLGALTEARVTRKIEPAGSAARYERRVGDNHHHVVCTECGAIADVDCVVGHAPCLTPSDAGGFAISTAEVTFWGVCADCQRADGQRAAQSAAGPNLAGPIPASAQLTNANSASAHLTNANSASAHLTNANSASAHPAETSPTADHASAPTI